MAAADESTCLLCAAFVAPISTPLIRDAAVAIRGDRIAAVGPAGKLRADFPAAQTVDLGNVVLLPGLINAHVHLELSDRTPGDPPASFVDWLLKVMGGGPAPDAVETTITRATGIGVHQSLAAGVTTVADITRFPQITRKVIADSPLRAVSFGEVTAMASRRHLLASRLEAALAPSPAPQQIISAVSPHAPYSIEIDGYRACVQAAARAGVPIATHLAESPDEAAFLADHTAPFRRLWETIGGWDDAVPRFAGGPIRMARAVGLLDMPHALLAHVNYADEAELALLAAGRATVVYCPRTHAYFGHPPHVWRRMLELGINVAVGTDSTASSPNLDLVEDLRLLHTIAPDVDPAKIWALATVCGARALGLEQQIGTIEAGKSADLVAFHVRNTADPLREVLESPVRPAALWAKGVRHTPAN